jgi:hypothetical protein
MAKEKKDEETKFVWLLIHRDEKSEKCRYQQLVLPILDEFKIPVRLEGKHDGSMRSDVQCNLYDRSQCQSAYHDAMRSILTDFLKPGLVYHLCLPRLTQDQQHLLSVKKRLVRIAVHLAKLEPMQVTSARDCKVTNLSKEGLAILQRRARGIENEIQKLKKEEKELQVHCAKLPQNPEIALWVSRAMGGCDYGHYAGGWEPFEAHCFVQSSQKPTFSANNLRSDHAIQWDPPAKIEILNISKQQFQHAYTRWIEREEIKIKKQQELERRKQVEMVERVQYLEVELQKARAALALPSKK